MKQTAKPARRYRFFLNPHRDVRFTACPRCRGKTRQRKVPLVIHVEPQQLCTLNKKCRYCLTCDLLIVHQDEVEAFLTAFFDKELPELVGNEYLVMGTMDREDWLLVRDWELRPQEVLEMIHDFRQVLRFEVSPAGWVRQ